MKGAGHGKAYHSKSGESVKNAKGKPSARDGRAWISGWSGSRSGHGSGAIHSNPTLTGTRGACRWRFTHNKFSMCFIARLTLAREYK